MAEAEAEGGIVGAPQAEWVEVPPTPLDDPLARIEAKLDAIHRGLDIVNGKIEHLVGTLEHFRPVIDAYLSPTASGPVAWAVRQRLRKGGTDDT